MFSQDKETNIAGEAITKCDNSFTPNVKASYRDTCCRERNFKEELLLKIKQQEEVIEGLKALYRCLPTEVNERDDRAIRNALKLLS